MQITGFVIAANVMKLIIAVPNLPGLQYSMQDCKPRWLPTACAHFFIWFTHYMSYNDVILPGN